MRKKLLRLVSIIVCIVLACTLVACNKDDGGKDDGGGGGVNTAPPAYSGGGTAGEAEALTASSVDDDIQEYFVSGTIQTIIGVTETDVTNYKASLTSNGWRLLDFGANAAADEGSYSVYYKGDTIVALADITVSNSHNLIIETIVLKKGAVQSLISGGGDDYVPDGTKYTSWPTSQITNIVGIALPEWTNASAYYFTTSSSPAVTVTITFKGTANDALLYQQKLTHTDFGFISGGNGSYSKTVGSSIIGVGVVEANGYVSVAVVLSSNGSGGGEVEEPEEPDGTKYTSWPTTQITNAIGMALPEWTNADAYFLIASTSPAVTVTITFVGTANDALLYQQKLTHTDFGFISDENSGSYSKEVGTSTIGVVVAEADGYVSVTALIITGGGEGDDDGDIPEYMGGGTVGTARTLSATDLDDDLQQYFVSGTVQTIVGVTDTDVNNYRAALITAEWTYIDMGANATSNDAQYIYYKGDTIVTLYDVTVENSRNLVIEVIVLEEGSVQLLLNNGGGENNNAPALADVQTRIANSYPNFTFSASGITVSDDYLEMGSAGAFCILLSAADTTVLLNAIVSDFDAVVSSFGYTKTGTTTVSYEKDSLTYIEVSIDGNDVCVSLPMLPPQKGTWPATEIEDYVQGQFVPEYTVASADANFSGWIGTNQNGYGFIISGTTETEYNAYISTLTSEGFEYNDNENYYQLTTIDGVIGLSVEYEQNNVAFKVIFFEFAGDLTEWPTASLAEDINPFTLPAFLGATSFSYDSTYWLNGSGIITLIAYGVDETELGTYFNTTLSDADRVSDDRVRILRGEKQLIIEYTYYEDLDYVTFKLSIKEYVAPDYTKIPANFKMTYIDEYNTESSFYHVGNDWCYLTEGNQIYWKYNETTEQWTRYEYEETGDVAWTPVVGEDDIITSANFDDLVRQYWGGLLKVADEDFLSGTKGTETILGIECDTYTYSDDYATYFIAIAQDDDYCLKYTVGGYLAEKFEITAFKTSGVTMPESDFPVSIEAEIAWPTEEINADVGGDVVPEFTGETTMFNYVDGSIIRIRIKDVTLADFNEYKGQIVAAGYTQVSASGSEYTFVKNDANLSKTFTLEVEYYGDEESTDHISIKVSSDEYVPSSWPKAGVDEFCGTDVVPAYVTAVGSFSELTVYEYMDNTKYVTIKNSSESEFDTYKSALEAAGFTLSVNNSSSDLLAYFKIIDGKRVMVKVGLNAVSSATIYLCSDTSHLWPTAEVDAYIGVDLVPAYEAADPYMFIFDDSFVSISGTNADEVEAYKATLEDAGYVATTVANDADYVDYFGYVKTMENGNKVYVGISEDNISEGYVGVSYYLAESST